jgi:hypothetical protein
VLTTPVYDYLIYKDTPKSPNIFVKRGCAVKNPENKIIIPNAKTSTEVNISIKFKKV